ncbi:MAG: hypothetical protein ACXIU8_15985 [Alkalilacustris sp.]
MTRDEVLEIDTGAGAPVGLVLRRVARGADGPVLEGLCPATGEARHVPLSAVRALRHAGGRPEDPAQLVARHLGRLWWLGRADRLAGLAIVMGAAWLAHVVQGPKGLGLYAQMWSFVLAALGGGLLWGVVRRGLGGGR